MVPFVANEIDGERRMGMQELLQSQNALEEKVEALDHAIRGNGKPGINERLCIIEIHLSRIEYWFGIVIKILTPIFVSLLLLGITGWIKAVV